MLAFGYHATVNPPFYSDFNSFSNLLNLNNMSKVLVNNCYGGFGFSELFINHMNAKHPELSFGHSDERTGVFAEEAVAFGLDLASGPFAKLTVEEIPDGVSYDIHEYDGMEHIAHTYVTLNMSDLKRGLSDEQIDLVSKVTFVKVNDDRPNLADSWDGDGTHHLNWGC